MSSASPRFPGLRSIVAATDLSPSAVAAIEWANEIAIDHQAGLHLVHAANLAGWSTDYLEVDARIPIQVQEAARQRLEQLGARYREHNRPISTEVRSGEPCNVILTAAEDHEADLVVVGTRGERGLDYLLLGSTAQRVVQRAPCPVLTVHPQTAEQGTPIRNILLATDFSAAAEAALEFSLSLSRPGTRQTRMLLLHAYLVPYDLLDGDGFVSAAASLAQWQTAQADVEQRLEGYTRDLIDSGIEVTALGIEGYPPEIIVDKALEYEVDLIAMGTRGRTGLSHLLLGSTAERVIQRAPCPVLTVRKGWQDDRTSLE